MSFKILGPSFLALQVSDMERSKKFYIETLGLETDPAGPPHATVFKTQPIAFAIREPNIDLSASTKLGWGASPWFMVQNVHELYERLTSANVTIVSEIQPGPFGQFFSFQDPDGYILTAHETPNAG